jgi:hypothetical protein
LGLELSWEPLFEALSEALKLQLQHQSKEPSMPRRPNQQKQIASAVQQIASGLAGLVTMLLPAVPGAQAQTGKRRGRPPAKPVEGKRGRPGRPPKAAAKPRRKRRLSAKARQQFKLQGAYMGLVRRLPAAKKAALKKLRVAKGYEAAIAAARNIATKK